MFTTRSTSQRTNAVLRIARISMEKVEYDLFEPKRVYYLLVAHRLATVLSCFIDISKMSSTTYAQLPVLYLLPYPHFFKYGISKFVGNNRPQCALKRFEQFSLSYNFSTLPVVSTIYII